MADVVKLSEIHCAMIQWEAPAGGENPRLSQPIEAADTTIYFTHALLDEDGGQISRAVIIGIKNLETGYTENVFIPAGEMAADGLSATNVIRGLQLGSINGIDVGTKVTANAIDHPSESEVRVNIGPHLLEAFFKTLMGEIATGANVFILGDGTNSNATISHLDGASTKGWLRKNPTTGKAQFSNDGSLWVNFDNPGVGAITWGDGLNGGLAGAAPYVEIDDAPAYLTGGSSAESTAGTWAAVTDGSFRITIDGTAYNIDGIDFTGDATMANVASTIQAALRAATGGEETVVWSTDHFVITSNNFTSVSEVSVTSTSTGTVGTDISGAGASDWMDADTGNGTATALVQNSGLLIENSRLQVKPSLIQNNEWIYAQDTGAADAIVVTFDPALTSYSAGQKFIIRAANTNTGATTVNADGLGTKTIKKNISSDLDPGDIQANQIIELVYDGTNLQLVSAYGTGFIENSFIDAKGDLIIGSAADTPALLAIGSVTQALRRNASDQLAWQDIYFGDAETTFNNTDSGDSVVDTTVTVGFRPKLIMVHYKIIGKTSGTDKYSGGILVYNGSTPLFHDVRYSNLNLATGITPNDHTLNAGGNAGAGTDGASGNVQTLLSVDSITDTEVIVRANFNRIGHSDQGTVSFSITVFG